MSAVNTSSYVRVGTEQQQQQKTSKTKYVLRPILKQLDLQSGEKVPFSTFARAFAPKKLELGLPRVRMTLSFSETYPELFPASPGTQLQEITVSTFSIQLGQIRLHSPIGSQKTLFSMRWTIVIVFDPVGSKKC